MCSVEACVLGVMGTLGVLRPDKHHRLAAPLGCLQIVKYIHSVVWRGVSRLPWTLESCGRRIKEKGIGEMAVSELPFVWSEKSRHVAVEGKEGEVVKSVHSMGSVR